MPGAVLNEFGMPQRINAGRRTTPGQNTHTFPNRLVERDLGAKIYLMRQEEDGSLDKVRQTISDICSSQARMKHIDDVPTSFVGRYRAQRKAMIGVRKMMTRYWENSGMHALDLCSAVMRQGIFIEKMVKIDWLHSPNARDTINALLTKYSRFLNLMKKHPNNVLVPTLDVDLAWHTHQLNSQQYYSETTKMFGRFLDHDDKIEENKLNKAFAFTTQVYEEIFQEEYSTCTCWYCESMFHPPHRSGLI